MTPSAIQELCQSTLQDFNLCMFYQAPPSMPSPRLRYATDDRLLYLHDDLVFKVIIMCLHSIYHLQKTGLALRRVFACYIVVLICPMLSVNCLLAGTSYVAAAVAFSLALFSHVLNHVVIRLQSALYELENPRKILKVDTDGGWFLTVSPFLLFCDSN